MTEVFIAAAKRTPIGKLGGTLTGLSAARLGAAVIEAIVRELDLDPGSIDSIRSAGRASDRSTLRRRPSNAGMPV